MSRGPDGSPLRLARDGIETRAANRFGPPPIGDTNSNMVAQHELPPGSLIPGQRCTDAPADLSMMVVRGGARVMDDV
jgi:hypothetical protein